MKTKTMSVMVALLLTTVSSVLASPVSCTFSGIVTSTNGFLYDTVHLGDAVSGAFGYDSSLLTPSGGVTLSDHSAYMVFSVTGTAYGVGANNTLGSTTYVSMTIGADGLPVSSYLFNGLYTGTLGFSGGVGNGWIYNDSGLSGSVGFSVTNVTLNGFILPNAGTPTISSIMFSNGIVLLRCMGSRSAMYVLQSSTNLTSQFNWTIVRTNIADSSGFVSFTNTASSSAAFYRLFAP